MEKRMLNRVIAVIFLIQMSLFATPLVKYSDYDEAANIALKEKKKLILVNKRESCRWCQKLIHETLEDERVKKEIAKNYVLVLVDNSQNNYPIRFYSAVVPATFIINPNFTVEDDVALGYIKAESFLKLIRK
jgi:thioredoxin-related protein